MNQFFILAMLGARMHYAAPRILQEAGMLERFFTDLCASKGWPVLLQGLPSRMRPEAVRRVLSRTPVGIPPARIRAFQSFGWQYARRRARAATPSTLTETFLWANQRFGELVRESNWGSASATFTFNCAGLEILERAKQEGRFTVSEQTIAPSAIEQRLLGEERGLHPGWEPAVQDDFATQYSEREQTEWSLADRILCGSEFVREGIANCGGPVEKCVVVPYGVEVPNPKSEIRNPKSRNGPLQVLTVGAVGLRKGTPYVLEAAKHMEGRAKFRMVGSLGVSAAAQAELRAHLELTGPVPRSEVARHFEWAHVFLLPSICEGSATVAYEALARGLPVICTPNTGSVVRDGVDGFIVPVRETAALVGRLEQLARSPTQLAEMSRNARARAQDFTLDAYGSRLLSTLINLEQTKGTD